MIPRDAQRLYELIDSAEKIRTKHREAVAAMIARYHGPWYQGIGPATEEEYDPANAAYQYISLVMSVLAWDNPRFEVKAKRQIQGIDAEEAALTLMALKPAMDRWAVDTDLQSTQEDSAVDYLFSYSTLLTEMEPSPDQDPTSKEPRKRPLISCLDPNRFVVDPMATVFRDARVTGHAWVRDRDELIEHAGQHPEEGWDVAAIKKTPTDVGLEKLGRDREADNAPKRDEIVGFQLWIPEWETERAERVKGPNRRKLKGTLLDLAIGARNDAGTSSYFIREPRPFFGPSWGPYSMFGAYKVPNRIFPLGPLVATEGQNRELNAHKRAGLESARSRKRIGIANDVDPKLTDTIVDTRDGEVATVKMDNLDRNFREVELGGMTEEQRLAIIGLQSDLDNALGMSDAKRGEVSGIGTATENAIADASGNQRMSWKKKKFRGGFTGACRKAAWYIVESDDVELATPPEFAEATGITSIRGGQRKGRPGISFEDLEIDIELMSTERMDEGVAQARSMGLFNLAVEAMPVVAMFPMANWKEAFDQVGDSMNVPELGAKLGVEKVQAAAMNGELPEQQQEAPRMSGDSAQAQSKPPRISPQPARYQVGRASAKGKQQNAQGQKARAVGASK